MCPEHACCVWAIRAIRMTRERHRKSGEGVDNLCARCGTCGRVWVWQARIPDHVRLAVDKDGRPTSDGSVVRVDSEE